MARSPTPTRNSADSFNSWKATANGTIRWSWSSEITAKVSKLGCRIYEVGISYAGRTYAEGKKIGWRDGVRAVWCIFKYNLLR